MSYALSVASHDSTPSERLIADHERLERLLRALLIRAREGDAADVVEPWRAFEEGLRAHLLAEEEELFPEFAEEDAAEVRALRREHAEIRSLLDTAGFGVELHTARLLMLEDLAGRLRDHAERETHGLYAFADRASKPVRERVRERVTAAMHRAASAVF